MSQSPFWSTTALAFLVTLGIGGCGSAEFGSRSGQGSGDAAKEPDTGDGSGDAGADGDADAGGGDGQEDAGENGHDGDSGNDSDDDIDDAADGGIDGSDSAADGLETDDDTISADRCAKPTGDAESSQVVGGEDVPGNGLLGGPDKGKPYGSDFDDYALTFTGDLLVAKTDAVHGTIALASTAPVTVSYGRGTTDCSHEFRFVLRRCADKDSTIIAEKTLLVGTGASGSVTIKPPKAGVYMDVVMTVTSGVSTKFSGCVLPFPVENHLYTDALAGFLFP